LQELLRLDASRADRPQARALATVLAAWCRDGSYGPLFDGPTNLTFEGPLIYFELGRIPESLGELQTAAHFLVQNYVWQQIYTRPRSLRKRLIVEEAAAFLSRPGAAEILQRAYEQARKYNTWLVSVFQQYAALRDSRLRAAVMGNSQQFFLLKQNDASDLIQLGKDLGLSRSAMNAILSYPKPDQAGYSAFTYFHRAVPHPVCGTAYYVASPELAEVTRTSGAHVEPPRPADARSATPDHL
jgi:type IV secretory pathway VirB4 component